MNRRHGLLGSALPAFFLVEEDSRTLVLRAGSMLSSSHYDSCARLPLGECLCGICALSGEVVFAEHTDHRHSRAHPEMPHHGHYCIPLRLAEKIFGVLVVFLEPGHRYQPKEVALLQRASHIMAGLVTRRRAEQELRQHRERLRKLSRNEPENSRPPRRAFTTPKRPQKQRAEQRPFSWQT